MSSYVSLAEHYDAFTDDVNYSAWADFYERIWRRMRVKPVTVLDLACGTGTLTAELAQRGYDMTASDMSEDMLMVAREKCAGLTPEPLLLHQAMEHLDLNDTVDAAVCALDSINYITSARLLQRAFSRVSLFLNKGGAFIFDVNTEAKYRWLDGQSFVRENEGAMCIWQAAYSASSHICRMDMDIFEYRRGDMWERFSETHVQRMWPLDELRAMLDKAGLDIYAVYKELRMAPPDENTQRIFIACRKR